MTDTTAPTRPLTILTDADPMLHRPSAPVGEVTDEIRKLAYDMLETMYAARGIGLAAVQVGHPIRLLVIDTGTKEAPRPLIMVDPVIEWRKKLHVDFEEGCLSVPGRLVTLSRPADIEVSFTGHDGVRQKRGFGGLPARVIQHEIDHLDGIVMTERAKAA